MRFPLERIEIDEWQLDLRNLAINSGLAVGLSPKQLRALERVRRWAVADIDCATRFIAGLVITYKPSREATLKVIDQITYDKTQIAKDYGCKFTWHQHGRPGLIVMDNGSAFTPVRIRAAIAAIGADVMYVPAGVPELRGRIEHFFGTAARELMPELPGRTFANPKERGDYDSDTMACLTDGETSSILVRYGVNVSNQSEHEGLKRESPAACWDRLAALYRPDQEVDGYQRREAFGRPVFRKITGRGITVFGIEYASDLVRYLHLHSHVGEVEVRVDTRDVGWITMLHEGKWDSLNAKLNFLNGVRLSEWLATEKALKAKRHAQSRVTASMVREALDGIRATFEAARLRSNIALSSLTPQKIASALKEAYLGIKVAADTAASLEEFFVRSSRHYDILTEILLMHEARKSAAGQKSLRETRGFAHIAPTGSGKTRTLEKIFCEVETSNGKAGTPGKRIIVSVRVRTPANLKSVGISILKALGYIDADRKRSSSDSTFADIWEVIYHQLELQGIEILHLDEAQDLYQNANILQRLSIINTLKTLTQNNQWPICLVLSVIEDLKTPLNDDPQLGRRFTVIGIEALNYAVDRKMIRKIRAHYIKEEGCTSDLSEEKEFIQSLIVSSVGRMGIVIEVVIGAIKAAILTGASQVSVQHLAAAYHRRTDCDVDQNPFLAAEWRVIDARKILARDGDAKPLAPLKRPGHKSKQAEAD